MVAGGGGGADVTGGVPVVGGEVDVFGGGGEVPV